MKTVKMFGATGHGITKEDAIANSKAKAIAGELDQDPVRDHRKLSDDMVMAIVPTRIQVMMTGAKLATQNNKGHVILTYTDDATQTAQIDEPIAGMEWFAVVKCVQSQGNIVEMHS